MKRSQEICSPQRDLAASVTSYSPTPLFDCAILSITTGSFSKIDASQTLYEVRIPTLLQNLYQQFPFAYLYCFYQVRIPTLLQMEYSIDEYLNNAR